MSVMLVGLSSLVLGLTPLLLVVVLLVGSTIFSRRRGYHLGTDVIVRCRDGHLFTTIRIPGGTFA